jgi:hypothetical protein
MAFNTRGSSAGFNADSRMSGTTHKTQFDLTRESARRTLVQVTVEYKAKEEVLRV